MSGRPTFIVNYGASAARQGSGSYKSKAGVRRKSGWGGRKWKKGAISTPYGRKSGAGKSSNAGSNNI